MYYYSSISTWLLQSLKRKLNSSFKEALSNEGRLFNESEQMNAFLLRQITTLINLLKQITALLHV